MIHDAQFDYFGKRIATASSDKTVKIFSVAGDKQTFICDLKGHEGPVWQVCWAHPKFGQILASCSYDGKVIIWKETPQGWKPIFNKPIRPSGSIVTPVNSISWAPHSFGLLLAAASADGYISLLNYVEQKSTCEITSFEGHKGGANSVSWGPDVKTGSLLTKGSPAPAKVLRLATGGCDNRLKVWRFVQDKGKWQPDRFKNDDNRHSDWIRDVAWAPSLGLPTSTIATASEDKTVAIWNEDPKSGQWFKKQTLTFTQKVWRVSWSVMANILAVAQGDNNVSLWKQSLEGTWQNLSSVKEKEKTEKKDGKKT
eukprot:TRINITY_DN40188_c0_g1_i1.p1 TRINITY_DN40188_c0_g1~~TRINITY_DN40188_c0_g1_i1.p1  ORF type:complete len:311 (-),score=28.00 TRINITY_DN40188_c0_g1_i1:76-1008(-)